ncbi:nuclear transport factor 2 family protein [Streptomyces sp. NPDC005963]|uniref:nuclear transport factor 2 family protein n=1 Tax=Streptomyces sp. NPDC005963 TaxID=3156721 RepID=UPI0033D50720
MTDSTSHLSPRAVAEAYFKRMDAGQDFLDLFADDAYVCFPKHAPARGLEEVRGLFGDIFVLFRSVVHEIAYFNYIAQGDFLIVEGTTHGELADGTRWRATEGLGGRFCNVFEIREGKIRRLHIYLDPDYGDADTERYPWLAAA